MFVVQEVFFVQGKQGLDEVVGGAGEAGGGVADIGGGSEAPSRPEAEFRAPESVLQDGGFKRRGVGSDQGLERGEEGAGIVDRNAVVSFGEVDDGAEAEGGLLVEVVTPGSVETAFVEDTAELVEVAIDEVDFGGGSLDPGASVDPGTPTVELGDEGGGAGGGEGLGGGAEVRDGERRGLVIVDPDVEVGAGVGEAAGIGSPEDEGGDVRDIAEGGDGGTEQVAPVGGQEIKRTGGHERGLDGEATRGGGAWRCKGRGFRDRIAFAGGEEEIRENAVLFVVEVAVAAA